MSQIAKAIAEFESTFKSHATKAATAAPSAPSAGVFEGLVKSAAAKKAAKFAPKKSKKTKPAARQDYSGNYRVAKVDAAQRGFLLDYVTAASKMKTVTREKLNAKFEGLDYAPHVRLLRYFAYCVQHGIFVATKK